jgi:hypothetical protein
MGMPVKSSLSASANVCASASIKALIARRSVNSFVSRRRNGSPELFETGGPAN